MLEILKHPNPILREKSEPVSGISDEVIDLIDNMINTMRAAGGIGLAAPQVGVLKRIIVMEVNDKIYQMINPVITSRGGLMSWDEGCLSIPDVHINVIRDAFITVSALHPDGYMFMENAYGLLAACIQHEIDHLDGVLIIDK